MNNNNFENGENWNYPPDGGNNSPYDDPFGFSNGDRPPYPPVHRELPAKGKGFAITAFVLAIVAFIFFLSGVYVLIQLGAAEILADEWSNSDIYYYVDPDAAEVLKISAKLLFIMSMIVAVVSIVLVIFAYDRHFQNVRNGVRAKYVLVFAILATVFANISLFISIILL